MGSKGETMGLLQEDIPLMETKVENKVDPSKEEDFTIGQTTIL